MPLISIIIPTFNEESALDQLLPFLKSQSNSIHSPEIIIADGHSTDQTVATAKKYRVRVISKSGHNRASQMNKGAKHAQGHLLYFLHADTVPPSNFLLLIESAVQEGFQAGSFQMVFDHNHWFLNAFAWFTRFNVTLFRFGDQSLLVTKEAFQAIEGFNENLDLMEDQEITYRLKKHFPFKVIREPVRTSARKYRENGIYYQQGVYGLVYLLYYLGVPQKHLKNLKNKSSKS